MSADNYYVVRKHPSGGFTYVQGFASDEDEVLVVHPNAPQFRTWRDALDAASREYSEYGAMVADECYEDQVVQHLPECARPLGDPVWDGSCICRPLTAHEGRVIARNNREWAETALDDEAASYADGKSDGWTSGIWTGWAIGCAVWLPMVVWVAVTR